MTAPTEDRRIGIACDHAGFDLKESVKAELESRDFQVTDEGTHSDDSVDYPDFAAKLSKKISKGDLPFGILICGTGIGVSITANKFKNVRAAVATDTFMAKASRQHNDANILCLGARVLTKAQAVEVLDAWLNEDFEGGRHQRRVDKIRSFE